MWAGGYMMNSTCTIPDFWQSRRIAEKERGAIMAQAFVPLRFAAGEADQFDWSHEIAVIGGATSFVKVAHVRLCHSL